MPDHLDPDPRSQEPSPVPGMTRLEFDEYAANIRWFSKIPVDQVLAETRRFAEEERWMATLARQLDER